MKLRRKQKENWKTHAVGSYYLGIQLIEYLASSPRVYHSPHHWHLSFRGKVHRLPADKLRVYHSPKLRRLRLVPCWILDLHGKNNTPFSITSEELVPLVFFFLRRIFKKVGILPYPLQKIGSVYSVQIGKAPMKLDLIVTSGLETNHVDCRLRF